jgi:hypothetical protein
MVLVCQTNSELRLVFRLNAICVVFSVVRNEPDTYHVLEARWRDDFILERLAASVAHVESHSI